MEYKLSLGAWNTVFAVPAELVDKHLKLAGGVQLKVMLYLLRNAGQALTAEMIGEALSLPAADVNDSMLYWEQTGLVSVCDGIVSPDPDISEQISSVSPEVSPDTEEVSQKTEEKPEPKHNRILSRPEKPDLRYLSRRMSESPEIAYLMQAADEIFGRLTNNNDKATLLMIHETDGLPVDVIVMLMQYAADIGKCNIRYIEKMALTWADDEIFTLELAEQRIKRLTDGRTAAGAVQRIFGLESHSPTEKETELSDRWINEWGFSEDMLRTAYEICVDKKSKYIPSYVNSILERWYGQGISTPAQAEQDRLQKGGKKKMTYGGAYDISAYESTSIADEE